MREDHVTEFKESWRDEYLKWICGFANAHGGTLILGKNDKGVAVGVDNAARLLQDLPNKVRDVLGVMADVRLRRVSGKDLVEVRVDAYPSPVNYHGEYHYRSGSTKQELKGAALDRFLMRKYGRTWDSAPFPRVAVRDLSKQAILLFKKLAKDGKRLEPGLLRESAANLVEKLGLTEGTYLKRAALLLFHPEPDRHFLGAFVKIGYFRNEADLLYHDEIHGDLFTQAQKTLELLLTKYLKAGISYRGIQRIESYPVPEEAIREVVLNALIHRDYANAAPIQIRVFDDRLRIWNPGVLPESWTVRKLYGPHSSIPYNPLIANAFFRAGEIEAWGRGIQRIVGECTDAGVAEPVISYEPSDFTVEFEYSSEYLRSVSSAVDGKPKGHPTSTPHVPHMYPTSTPQVLAALSSEGAEMSRDELQRVAGLADRVHFYREHLKAMLAAGLIEPTIPDKPRSSRQKYRLTSKGRATLPASTDSIS